VDVLLLFSGLTAGVIASIVVAVIFVFIITALGLFTICRYIQNGHFVSTLIAKAFSDGTMCIVYGQYTSRLNRSVQ